MWLLNTQRTVMAPKWSKQTDRFIELLTLLSFYPTWKQCYTYNKRNICLMMETTPRQRTSDKASWLLRCTYRARQLQTTKYITIIPSNTTYQSTIQSSDFIAVYPELTGQCIRSVCTVIFKTVLIRAIATILAPLSYWLRRCLRKVAVQEQIHL